jgi:hypothetical protein
MPRLLIDRVGADLWVVQRSTRGPFAEISRVPPNLVHRVQAVPGVRTAREFVYHTIQRERAGKPLRIAVMGLSWPIDKGEWLPLSAGRHLSQNHFEMIADETLRLPVGSRIELGKEIYIVVGTTRNFISSNGDGIAFVTVQDAQAIQFDVPGEGVRLERAARETRGEEFEAAMKQPALLDNAGRPTLGTSRHRPSSIECGDGHARTGCHVDEVAAIIGGWSDVSVYTQDGQRQNCCSRFRRKDQSTDRSVSSAVDDHRRHHHGTDSVHADARQDSLDCPAQTDRSTQQRHSGTDLAAGVAAGREWDLALPTCLVRESFRCFPDESSSPDGDVLQLP